MHDFRYRGNKLFCEGVAVESLARRFGTPLYVYSQRTLTGHFQRLDAAFSPVAHLVCFALKANGNLSVLRALANRGSGFDIVSGGELQRVIAAGGDPRRCVFAGVAKTGAEIEFALRQNIYAFNVESEPELQRINRLAARLGKIAPFAVRVNPDVPAGTHAKITTGTYANKFGIALEQVAAVYARARRLKNLRPRGVQMHIGSQLTSVAPFEQAVRKVLPLVRRLQAEYALEFFSIGGGLGIVYQPALASGPAAWWRSPAAKNILTPEKYAARLLPLLKPLGLKILIEPGRFIVGNAGILVTSALYHKNSGQKRFLIVDAGMNDLIRPSLYDAYHDIRPVMEPASNKKTVVDVVGPICESGDFLARDRELPEVQQGDLLAVMGAGAYGFSMSSNYNSRSRAAEVMVKGNEYYIVRERETYNDLIKGEKVPRWLMG